MLHRKCQLLPAAIQHNGPFGGSPACSPQQTLQARSHWQPLNTRSVRQRCHATAGASLSAQHLSAAQSWRAALLISWHVSDRALELHVGETTLAFPLSATRASELASAVQVLLQTFAEKQKAERPRRYKSMEYRFQGDRASSKALLRDHQTVSGRHKGRKASPVVDNTQDLE